MSKWTWVLALPLLLVMGCEDKGPATKSFTITETRVTPTASEDARPLDSAARFGFRARPKPRPRQPGPAGGSRFTLRWSAPSAWKELGPNSMRLVTFQVTPDTECYVVRLPGQAGGVMANVNRWRKQMGLEPARSEEIARLPKQRALGVTGVLIDLEGAFTGMGKSKQTNARLLGLIFSYRGQTVFLKMTGPSAEVEANRPGFLRLCRSLRDESVSQPMQPPEKPGPNLPPPPQQASVEWDVPPGWEKAASSSGMRLVTFRVPVEGGKPAECYITALHGPAGGEVANLQRWRRQLGLAELSEAELGGLTTATVLGKTVKVLEAVGAYKGMQGPSQPSTYLIGIAVPTETQTLFVKLVAPGAAKAVQRDAFLAFLKSLRVKR